MNSEKKREKKPPKAKAKVRKGTLKQVLRYVGKYPFSLSLTLVLAIVTVGFTLYVPILVGDAIDCIVDKGQVDFSALKVIFFKIGASVAVTAVAQWLMSVFNNKITFEVVKDIRADAFAKISRLPLKYLDSHSHGDTVSRIICRPFVGGNGKYTRTENRRDFSIDPPGDTVLDLLKANGKDVIAVGKIEDIFNHRGITETNHTKNNHTGTQATIDYLRKDFDGLLFVNLVDFDMLYGHRRNPEGYARALEEFDARLPEIQSLLRPDDILILTADHGCDPTFHGTDHTREYTPLLVCGPKLKQGVDLGIRSTFSDIAATVADCFGLQFPTGTSFLPEIKD